MQWYAVYTKPKREDAVAGSLENAGIEVFNPRLKQKKYMQGAYRNKISPLFPCYVFVKFEPETTSHMIKYTRGVKRVVGGDLPWPVSDEIIDVIRNQEEDGVITIKPPQFKYGDSVAINDGPLSGLRGIFEKELNGQERVVLLLSSIEYQARAVVDKAFLTKAA
ncbi:MAG: transcription termination/antitermination NusG family protein [Nitrospirota bacterium]|nr:transcription termination/antitermination NusG family protein [Nitrospirota bacterium]